MSQNQTLPPRVACLIVTYNRADFVVECINSLLREDGEHQSIEITVTNNGALDETAEVLEAIDDPRVTVRTKETNQILNSVLNECLEIGHASGADYLLLLNDDIEMKPGAVTEMVSVCNEHPMSIVNPLQINYRRPDEIDSGQLKLLQNTPGLLDDALLQGAPQRSYPQRTMIGAAMLAKAETFKAVGDFDPIFPFYGLDDDYSNRSWDMGVPLRIAMRAHMLHMHGKTTAEAAQKQSKEDWLRRWSSHYRARAIFRIKDPKNPLLPTYIKVVSKVFFDIPLFLAKTFPGGVKVAARTFVFLVSHYGQIARRREIENRRAEEFKVKQGKADPS